MRLHSSILFVSVLVSFMLLSSGTLAVEKINIVGLKNNINSLEKFSIEIDSYLATLKSQGYVIDAEEKIWNNIKVLISEATPRSYAAVLFFLHIEFSACSF